jgi:acetate kinase
MGGGVEEMLVATGAIEGIGQPQGRLWLRSNEGEGHYLAAQEGKFPDNRAASHAFFDALGGSGLPPPSAAGHRIVHGGRDYADASIINARLLQALRELVPLAPLHLPGEILCIETVAERFPGLPQAACFDTAFHRRMPEMARRFPLPRHFYEEGILRYGFHGLSYEYILEAIGPQRMGRLVIAHLGNGASMAAVKDGNPLDTTMGFSPAGGFMMGTRSGDLDPGILIYLMSEKGFSRGNIERLVNKESGLLGVSGISSDMKALLEKRESEPAAAQAIDMFCYHLAKSIGALAAALGGLDMLVFTGGIGEHAAPVRQDTCERLAHLGVRLDQRRNSDKNPGIISSNESACLVRVVPTNEDLVIARKTHKLLKKKQVRKKTQ